MTEFLTFLVGAMIVAAVGYAGFLGGRDSAERKCAETIANLRRSNMVLRHQRDRAVENNARLARFIGASDNPDPDLPEWLSNG